MADLESMHAPSWDDLNKDLAELDQVLDDLEDATQTVRDRLDQAVIGVESLIDQLESLNAMAMEAENTLLRGNNDEVAELEKAVLLLVDELQQLPARLRSPDIAEARSLLASSPLSGVEPSEPNSLAPEDPLLAGLLEQVRQASREVFDELGRDDSLDQSDTHEACTPVVDEALYDEAVVDEAVTGEAVTGEANSASFGDEAFDRVVSHDDRVVQHDSYERPMGERGGEMSPQANLESVDQQPTSQEALDAEQAYDPDASGSDSYAQPRPGEDHAWHERQSVPENPYAADHQTAFTDEAGDQHPILDETTSHAVEATNEPNEAMAFEDDFDGDSVLDDEEGPTRHSAFADLGSRQAQQQETPSSTRLHRPTPEMRLVGPTIDDDFFGSEETSPGPERRPAEHSHHDSQHHIELDSHRDDEASNPIPWEANTDRSAVDLSDDDDVARDLALEAKDPPSDFEADRIHADAVVESAALSEVELSHEEEFASGVDADLDLGDPSNAVVELDDKQDADFVIERQFDSKFKSTYESDFESDVELVDDSEVEHGDGRPHDDFPPPQSQSDGLIGDSPSLDYADDLNRDSQACSEGRSGKETRLAGVGLGPEESTDKTYGGGDAPDESRITHDAATIADGEPNSVEEPLEPAVEAVSANSSPPPETQLHWFHQVAEEIGQLDSENGSMTADPFGSEAFDNELEEIHVSGTQVQENPPAPRPSEVDHLEACLAESVDQPQPLENTSPSDSSSPDVANSPNDDSVQVDSDAKDQHLQSAAVENVHLIDQGRSDEARPSVDLDAELANELEDECLNESELDEQIEGFWCDDEDEGVEVANIWPSGDDDAAMPDAPTRNRSSDFDEWDIEFASDGRSSEDDDWRLNSKTFGNQDHATPGTPSQEPTSAVFSRDEVQRFSRRPGATPIDLNSEAPASESEVSNDSFAGLVDDEFWSLEGLAGESTGEGQIQEPPADDRPLIPKRLQRPSSSLRNRGRRRGRGP